jgi:tetratricopeptide (TPR) repeat protein
MKRTILKYNCRVFILLLVICFGDTRGLKAQNKTLDSFNLVLKNAKHDTTRAAIYISLSEELFNTNPDTIVPLCEKAIALAEKNLASANKKERRSYLFTLASGFGNMGVTYDNKGKIMEALKVYSRSLGIFEEIGDKLGIAHLLNNMAVIHNKQGQIRVALDYYGRSLKIKEELGDKKGIAATLNNIGSIYEAQGQEKEALEYYGKSLKVREEIHDKKGIAQSLNNIGYVHFSEGNDKEALDFYNRSLKIQEETGNKNGIAICLNNIGLVHKSKGRISEALEYYYKSLHMNEKIGNERGVAYLLSNIGSVYLQLKNYGKTIQYARKSLQLSRSLGYPENIKNAAKLLYDANHATGNYRDALENFELFIQMRDSISNTENKKASVKSQLKYEYEKQAAADSVKNAEQQKVKDAQLSAQNAQIEQEKFQRYALVVGLFVVLGGLGFVINRFRLTRKQKKIIEAQKIKVDEAYEKLHEKNKEVMDSIYYARRIQRALITNEKYIERNIRKLNK